MTTLNNKDKTIESAALLNESELSEKKKLPFLKFVGNARKQMLFLKADKIDQIKRDKRYF